MSSSPSWETRNQKSKVLIFLQELARWLKPSPLILQWQPCCIIDHVVGDQWPHNDRSYGNLADEDEAKRLVIVGLFNLNLECEARHCQWQWGARRDDLGRVTLECPGGQRRRRSSLFEEDLAEWIFLWFVVVDWGFQRRLVVWLPWQVQSEYEGWIITFRKNKRMNLIYCVLVVVVEDIWLRKRSSNYITWSKMSRAWPVTASGTQGMY